MISLCVAVDNGGNALVTTNPADASPIWSAPVNIDAGTNSLVGITCPTTALCVAVDSGGDAVVTTDPSVATPTWSAPTNIRAPEYLRG